MLKIRRLSLRNWLSVAEAEVTFPSHGLVAVLGENRAAQGQLASIGAGKTALGEALARMLFGLTGRFTQLGQCSRLEAGNTYLRLEAEISGQSWVVEHGYKCPELSQSGEGLRLTVDGSRLEHGHVSKTRGAVLDALQLTPELAAWTVYLDGARLRFDQLSQAEAVELILRAMRQPQWQTYMAGAKKVADQRKLELAQAERDCQTWQTVINTATDECEAAERAVAAEKARLVAQQADYDTKLSAWVERRHTLDTAAAENDAKLADVRAKLDTVTQALEAGVAQDPALEAAIAKGKASVSAWDQATRDARVAVSTAASNLSTAEANLKSYLAGGRCAHCGHVSRTPEPTHVAKLKESVEQLRAELTQAKQAHAEATDTLARAETWLDTKKSLKEAAERAAKAGHVAAQRALLAEQRQLTIAQTDLAGQLRRHEAAKPAQPSDAALKAAQDNTVAAKSRLDKATAKRDSAASARSQATRELAVATYWQKAFSPAGIPNLVLRSGAAALNRAAQLVSQAVAGGAVGLEFKTEVELAGGEAKPKLSVAASHAGSKRLAGGSKGEQGLVNLLVAEAISAVAGCQVGFRWLDEPVNSQDHHVRRQVYQYLRRQAAERQLLNFMVDHHPDLEGYADHVLLAVKGTDGCTTYQWR